MVSGAHGDAVLVEVEGEVRRVRSLRAPLAVAVFTPGLKGHEGAPLARLPRGGSAGLRARPEQPQAEGRIREGRPKLLPERLER